jgi:L-2-hydroxyglutarate oxidase LhgO
VHFTRTISGDVYVGPTAIPAFGRENYGLVQGISSEALRIVKDIALMYVANQQNFRNLMHSEMKKYVKPYFIRAARKLVSTISANDLQSSNKVGIRAQLINLSRRKIEMDYIIEQDANSMHVLNAISPAFTGAFRFAELLVDRIS